MGECEEKHKKVPIRISKRVATKVCDNLSLPGDDNDVEVIESMKKNQESGEDINIDIDIDHIEPKEKNHISSEEQENSGKRYSEEDKKHKKNSDEDSSEENSSEEE